MLRLFAIVTLFLIGIPSCIHGDGRMQEVGFIDNIERLQSLLEHYTLDDLEELLASEPLERNAIENDIKYSLATITPLLGKVSPKCYGQGLDYIIDLFNITGRTTGWGKQMFDSNGKAPNGLFADHTTICDQVRLLEEDECGPTLNAFSERHPLPQGHGASLGSYMTCLNVEKETGVAAGQFCPMKMALDWVDLLPGNGGDGEDIPPGYPMGGTYWITDMLANVTERDLYVKFMNARVGMCIPIGCSRRDVRSNFEQVYEAYQAKMSVILPCVTAESEAAVNDIETTAEWAYIGLLIFLTVVVVLGTGLELMESRDTRLDDPKAKPTEASFLTKTVKCFALRSNIRRLMQTGRSKDAIGCLDGMRVFSMTWVVLAHVYGNMPHPYGAMNFDWKAKKSLGADIRYMDELIVNGWFCVDTFFYLSGLLVAYLSFIEMERKRFSLPLFYILRYLRLTIPLALVMGFASTLYLKFLTGPLAPLYSVSGCNENWWYNLLYIQIYTDEGLSCIGQTWYLAADMAMFVCSPVVLLPLYYWNKNNWGTKWWAALTVFFMAVPLGQTIKYELPPFGITVVQVNESFGEMRLNYYHMPYNRAVPYLVGIMVGYILFKLRGKELKIHWLTNVVAWVMSATVAILVLFGLHGIRGRTLYHHPGFTRFEAGFYELFAKFAWSVPLAWVTIACTKGYGGLINKFLSWGVFQPLAKLSYMAYLLHGSVIFWYAFTRSYELPDGYWPQTFHYVGLVSISFACAFVATLWLEIPFGLLIKVTVEQLMGGRKKAAKDSKHAKSNGTINGRDSKTASKQ